VSWGLSLPCRRRRPQTGPATAAPVLLRSIPTRGRSTDRTGEHLSPTAVRPCGRRQRPQSNGVPPARRPGPGANADMPRPGPASGRSLVRVSVPAYGTRPARPVYMNRKRSNRPAKRDGPGGRPTAVGSDRHDGCITGGNHEGDRASGRGHGGPCPRGGAGPCAATGGSAAGGIRRSPIAPVAAVAGPLPVPVGTRAGGPPRPRGCPADRKGGAVAAEPPGAVRTCSEAVPRSVRRTCPRRAGRVRTRRSFRAGCAGSPRPR
jgi:hypothetical protein